MAHTAIPIDELNVFRSLPDVKVVFDVGARDDVDYLIIKPKIKLHAFEPNPLFYAQLVDNVGKRKGVYLNNFGLGDIEGTFEYIDGHQAIGVPAKTGVMVKRLDAYVKKYKIKRIDFLKIDTEGYELRVLRGAGSEKDGYELLKMCRYIQHEGGVDNIELNSILQRNGFACYYTGYRNYLCVGNGQPIPWIPEETKEGELVEKDKSNYLHESN